GRSILPQQPRNVFAHEGPAAFTCLDAGAGRDVAIGETCPSAVVSDFDQIGLEFFEGPIGEAVGAGQREPQPPPGPGRNFRRHDALRVLQKCNLLEPDGQCGWAESAKRHGKLPVSSSRPGPDIARRSCIVVAITTTTA